MRVLNLGAGVQSTVIYAMMVDGEYQPADVAIFADTGDEPKDVYAHVEFLKTLGGPKIVTVSAGNLGDNLIATSADRFVSIPAFMSREDNGENTGIGRRQCTSEYKIKPIEAEIRRMVGIEPGQQLPKGVAVEQIFGLSFDEPSRVAKVVGRFATRKNWTASFPLFDEYITRPECETWLAKRFPGYRVPRSACVYCPYHDDAEWIETKKDPQAWARVVQIDRALRDPASACVEGLDSTMYLHRSCQPIELVQLDPKPPSKQIVMSWSRDCEGMCGN